MDGGQPRVGTPSHPGVARPRCEAVGQPLGNFQRDMVIACFSSRAVRRGWGIVTFEPDRTGVRRGPAIVTVERLSPPSMDGSRPRQYVISQIVKPSSTSDSRSLAGSCPTTALHPTSCYSTTLLAFYSKFDLIATVYYSQYRRALAWPHLSVAETAMGWSTNFLHG